MEWEVFGGSSGSGMLEGSGVPASETRTVPPFDRIELAGSNKVGVHVGGDQSVVVHADDNLIDRVVTEVSGRNLVIDNREGGFTTRTPMRVEVTVPTLDELTLNGSGTIAADGIAAGDMRVTISGSGVVNASGRTKNLEVTLAGSGDAQLAGLAADDVRAVVSGSGRIVVDATKSLDASVPGSGAVLYMGDPEHVTSTVTGTGVVTRGE